MNLVKSLLLFVGLAIGLSSCLVAGPGFYRRGGGGYHHHGHGHGGYRR